MNDGRRDERNAFRSGSEITSVGVVTLTLEEKGSSVLVVRWMMDRRVHVQRSEQPCVLISERPGQNRVA